MAVGAIGGREYYTDMVELTSGTTNCTDRGRIKGLLVLHNDVTLHFNGGFVKIAPTSGDILPFSPLGVTFASGSVHALY
jgi:hypothetical protein